MEYIEVGATLNTLRDLGIYASSWVLLTRHISFSSYISSQRHYFALTKEEEGGRRKKEEGR
jgi:hypothetical protein